MMVRVVTEAAPEPLSPPKKDALAREVGARVLPVPRYAKGSLDFAPVRMSANPSRLTSASATARPRSAPDERPVTHVSLTVAKVTKRSIVAPGRLGLP